MALSPLDIRTQSFTRRMRGFDTDEVGAFLSILAEHYDDLQREVRHSASRIADLEAKLVHYERIEDALQEALRTARESQRNALDTAAQQAEQIRTEARLEARSVVQEAEHDRNRLRQEAQAIGARRKEIVARLRAFLMSEMEMLAHFEGEDPIGFIQLRRDTAASLGPSAPLGGTLGTFESDTEIAARRAPSPPVAAPEPPPAEPPPAAPASADVHWASPSVATDDNSAPFAVTKPEENREEVPVGLPDRGTQAPSALAYDPSYTAHLDVENPDAAAVGTETRRLPDLETAPEADTDVDGHDHLSGKSSSRLASESHGATDAASVPTDRPGYTPAPPEWTFAPEPDEELIPEPPARDDAGAETGGEPTLVRPTWMDEVPEDLLGAPLVDEPTVETLASQPAVPSPLAERLARAASEAPAAPVPLPNTPEPARRRYVVTSFLGDDDGADAPSPAAVPQAESEEIARVRRLLDGLG